ncbi:ATPase [Burkholderia ubonensis]|uniref:AAA family ATPase n=1 Tax=Burkholderia ubonensis TaxID=101571 RepID=UPI000760AE2E|nr:ATP-binding protein [Burkholderia ubonensis]KVZ00179.1 ATPase [Burkholderia ubonensis]
MDTVDDTPYRDNQDLLQALCALGDTMIERALLAAHDAAGPEAAQRSSPFMAADGAPPFFLPPGAPDGARAPAGPMDRVALLQRAASHGWHASAARRAQQDHVEQALRRQWARLTARSAASVRAQVFLPWVHLTRLFQLDLHEQALLLCALLPELDARYGAIALDLAGGADTDAGAAAGDTFMPLASAARLLGEAAAARAEIQRRLTHDAVLRQWELVELTDGNRLATLSGGYRLQGAIAAYLLARAAPQLHLDEPLQDIEGTFELAEQLVQDAVKRQLSHFIARASAHDDEPASYLLHLQGPDPALLERLASATFATIGMHCARLTAKALWQAGTDGGRHPARFIARLRRLSRDALLCNRVLVLTDCHWLAAQDGHDDLLDDACRTLLDSQRYVVVLNGPARRLADLAHRHRTHRAIPVLVKSAVPDTALRRSIWERHLPAFGLSADEAVLTQLVNQYLFTEEQIVMAVKDAASRSLVDPDAGGSPERLYDACRDQSVQERLSVAQEVKTAYRMTDIVLSAATRQWLLEVLQYAQNRHQVVETWGFDAKHRNSRNLCVLFYGPSGTGKTMAASIIANELNLNLYRVDLASVVSKYIGDTEKQLAQLFDQAEAMNVVLFFDEAESLFAKRTDTKDAHDRYANLQTGYLLQRIETYPGIVILSTNLLHNMDKAFLRRFRFVIEYPFPNREQRLELWRHAFPAATPLAGDVDFALLAEKAPLAGGNINNIAIGAAFLAAADAQPVSQRHLLQATEREYHKLGKVFSAAEFSWGDEG